MYVKIFEQIFDSSVSEDYQTRLVFTDLLVLADEDGIVDMTIEAIARRTNVPLEIVRSGIQKLEQEDPQSRSKDEAGRRLVRLDDHRDWGWRIVNYEKYRMLRTKEDRKQYHRDYYRSNRSKEAKASQHDSTALNNSQQDSTDSTKRVASASAYSSSSERKTETEKERTITAVAKHLFENHDHRRRACLGDVERALQGIASAERERPIPSLMEFIRAQHTKWLECAGWKAGYPYGLIRWLEEEMWRDDPPEAPRTPAPQPRPNALCGLQEVKADGSLGRPIPRYGPIPDEVGVG